MTTIPRQQAILKAQETSWDMLIIGGGITGSAIAREAASRGLKTLLLEQCDFAWGTSSRSGKWVHGGLRYMQQGQPLTTYHSTREREALQKEVPGLVVPKNMFMAFYKGQWVTKLLLTLALFIYDLLRGKMSKHRLNARSIQKIAPDIRMEGLSGALIFQEAQTDDARLVLRILGQAQRDGASAINYCKVIGLVKNNGTVEGVKAIDASQAEAVSFTIHAKQVVNATGALTDKLRESVTRTNKNKVRPLRGSHLIFSADRIPISEALITFHPKDKRPGFIMPWEGRVVVGNTDIDHDQNLDDEAAISHGEVDYLMSVVHHYFPSLDLQESDIVSTFSGIRPVINSGKEDPSKESRDHMVFNEDGLITVTGGKLTTFRLIANDVLDEARGQLDGIPKTGKITVFDDAGAPPEGFDKFQTVRLHGRYGADAVQIVNEAQEGELEAIDMTHTLWAELRWSAANESVVHLDDLLLRRTRIGLLLENGGTQHFEQIGSICKPLLNWDSNKWHQEVERYQALWQQNYSVPTSDIRPV